MSGTASSRRKCHSFSTALEIKKRVRKKTKVTEFDIKKPLTKKRENLLQKEKEKSLTEKKEKKKDKKRRMRGWVGAAYRRRQIEEKNP